MLFQHFLSADMLFQHCFSGRQVVSVLFFRATCCFCILLRGGTLFPSCIAWRHVVSTFYFQVVCCFDMLFGKFLTPHRPKNGGLRGLAESPHPVHRLSVMRSVVIRASRRLAPSRSVNLHVGSVALGVGLWRCTQSRTQSISTRLILWR